MKTFLIRDSRNREVIRINGKGQIAIARYPDLDNSFKEYAASLYSELTGSKKKETMDFLNYKCEENEFCS